MVSIFIYAMLMTIKLLLIQPLVCVCEPPTLLIILSGISTTGLLFLFTFNDMLTLLFDPFPTLITQRFILRAPVLSDDETVAILRSDPRVNQYLHRDAAITVADARKFIEKIQGYISANESFYWVITTKEDDQLVGTVCYWNIEPALDRAEIGYELHSSFFGKGIMQEVLPEVIRFGFEQVQLQKITAFPLTENIRSVKLLERFHFTLDPALKESLEEADDQDGISCYSLNRPVASYFPG